MWTWNIKLFRCFCFSSRKVKMTMTTSNSNHKKLDRQDLHYTQILGAQKVSQARPTLHTHACAQDVKQVRPTLHTHTCAQEVTQVRHTLHLHTWASNKDRRRNEKRKEKRNRYKTQRGKEEKIYCSGKPSTSVHLSAFFLGNILQVELIFFHCHDSQLHLCFKLTRLSQDEPTRLASQTDVTDEPKRNDR